MAERSTKSAFTGKPSTSSENLNRPTPVMFVSFTQPCAMWKGLLAANLIGEADHMLILSPTLPSLDAATEGTRTNMINTREINNLLFF